MAHSVSSVRVKFEPLRMLAAASISALVHVAVGAPFSNPIRLLKITNTTDVSLLISFDGIDQHDIVPAFGFCLYDYGSNKTNQSGFLEQTAGERVYVQAITALPTLGAIYVTCMYAAQN